MRVADRSEAPRGDDDDLARSPSAPRTVARRGRGAPPPDAAGGRLQLAAVLALLGVLVAIPLYLWRRPRAVPEEFSQATEADAAVELAAPVASGAPAATAAEVDAGPPPPAPAPPLPAGLTLSEPRITECHDPGSKRTAARDCDHLPAFERALARAIADNASCVPAGPGGAIAYSADVSYQRKRQPIMLSLPREGRTLKGARTAAACAAAVRKTLATVALEDATHAHSRYRVEILATYAAAATKP